MENEVGGKEVWAQKAHVLPFPRDCPNPSPVDLPTRKKKDAVPPHLLNADPLAQIIGMETVADIIIDDAEAVRGQTSSSIIPRTMPLLSRKELLLPKSHQ